MFLIEVKRFYSPAPDSALEFMTSGSLTVLSKNSKISANLHNTNDQVRQYFTAVKTHMSPGTPQRENLIFYV